MGHGQLTGHGDYCTTVGSKRQTPNLVTMWLPQHYPEFTVSVTLRLFTRRLEEARAKIEPGDGVSVFYFDMHVGARFDGNVGDAFAAILLSAAGGIEPYRAEVRGGFPFAAFPFLSGVNCHVSPESF